MYHKKKNFEYSILSRMYELTKKEKAIGVETPVF